VRIAIQGEVGSFSHAAALQMHADFPHAIPDPVEIIPCAVSADVFDHLTVAADVDAAVIPIENSLAGSILEHYDLLLQHPVRILAEHRQRIRHNLIGLHGARVEHIERVFSHPIALAQCRNFLLQHPHILAVPFYDTAGAVKQVVEMKDRHLAAIASSQAAEVYGAEILTAGIEDNPENYTRFQLLRREADAKPLPGANRMSLAFALENRPGTLVAALQLLANLGVDLTKIESRPVPGKPWEYVFYVDLTYPAPAVSAVVDPTVHEAAKVSVADSVIAALTAHCPMVKELGRYKSN
jgi:prephenate dehydratase